MMMIRSQDGMSLTNIALVTDLTIVLDYNCLNYNVNAYYPHSIRDDYACMSLGKYSTKERAESILQEIQNQYQYLMECKYIGIGSSQPEFVYQMPKEE